MSASVSVTLSETELYLLLRAAGAARAEWQRRLASAECGGAEAAGCSMRLRSLLPLIARLNDAYDGMATPAPT